jgi:hypothetical protein
MEDQNKHEREDVPKYDKNTGVEDSAKCNTKVSSPINDVQIPGIAAALP